MAHLVTIEPEKKESRLSRVVRLFPKNLTGKFGFSLFTGKREIFIGVAVADVEIERVVRKRILKQEKAKTKVFNFPE